MYTCIPSPTTTHSESEGGTSESSMRGTSAGCCASNAAGAGGSESLGSDHSEPQCTVCSEEEWIDSTEESLATSSTVHTDSSDSTPQTTEAPPLQRTQFDSWEELESYLQQYSNDTYQCFRVRTNNKVEVRNKKIRANPGSKQPILPDKWIYYGKTFVCTHAGKYKARGQGKRKRQQSRSIECDVQINACVQVVDATVPTFSLRITSARLKHNHPLHKHTFEHYPHNRTALEPEVAGTVSELLKAGAKKKRILQYIYENSRCAPTTQDVHNLVRKLKHQDHAALTSAKRLKQWMYEFSQESGNVGRIFVDSVHNKTIATCITMQTAHMRELFERFPEVLMIDATHGTNASKYKVFSIMAHDAFGKGQFVQHAAVQNERSVTLLTALEEFKKNNPSWSRIKCILIDKDFTELGVLKMAFPGAMILLCQFHVLKYLREQIASSHYGFTSWQKHQLYSIVNLLVYAKTERQYLRVREYMRHIMSVGSGKPSRLSTSRELRCNQGHLATSVVLSTAGSELGTAGSELGTIGSKLVTIGSELGTRNAGVNTHPFEEYFVKNWDSCRSMWCAFERENAVTLGNNTNNRLEASWKQIKDLVNSFMAVDECIAAILCYQYQQEKSFKDRVYNISVVHNPKYDREMCYLSKLVSEHACELVYEQYYFATTKANYKFHETVPGVLLIQNKSDDEEDLDEPQTEYSLTKSDWSCSCLFMTSRLLHCRHVFFIRKALRCENVIPTHLLNSRWLLSSLRSDTEVLQLTGESFGVSRVLKKSTTCWDSNRKFREANSVASSITEHLSSLGMREFRVAMEVLREVDTRFKHGEYDFLARMTTGSSERNGSGALAATTSEVRSLSAEVGSELAELGTESAELGSESPGLGSESAELGSESADLATETELLSVSTELPPSGELVARNGELGCRFHRLGSGTEELVTVSTDLCSCSNEPVVNNEEVLTDKVVSHDETQVGTLIADGLNSEFEILSPPRSKGRPKQKPRVVKSKRKKAVAMVVEDMEMHESQLNLAAVREILQGAPTYELSHKCILQFKAYQFTTKPKPPIAYRTAQLSPTKPLMRPKEILRVFSMDLLNKCRAKVTAFQRKYPGTREMDISLEIIGVGVFENSTLALMRQWYTASKTLKKIQKTITWIQQLDFSRHTNADFNVEEDPYLPNKLKEMPVLSVEKTEVLKLAAKECLSDSVMQLVLKKRFGAEPDVKVVDPAHLGIFGGEITTENCHFTRVLTGVTKDTKVLFPINCNNNHWCAVLLNLQDGKGYIYDSMASSYLGTVRAVAQKLIVMIPDEIRPSCRLTIYDPGLGVQTDSYNCGLYVLLVFELFCGAEQLGYLDKKTLQLLRYRYIRMLIEA